MMSLCFVCLLSKEVNQANSEDLKYDFKVRKLDLSRVIHAQKYSNLKHSLSCIIACISS